MDAWVKGQLLINKIIWAMEADIQTAREEAEYRKLFEDLSQVPIRLVIWKESQGLVQKEDQKTGEPAVFLTDLPEVAKLQKDKGHWPLVYYDRSKSKDFVPADYVVWGFEEVGLQLLDRIVKRYFHQPWTVLFTERTCIKEIALSDLDELFALYEDPEITAYTEKLFDRPEEEAYTKSYIEAMYYYYGYGMWIIRDKETGQLVGRVGIDHREDPKTGEVRAELGYVIGKKWQRQGYATETCRKVIDFAVHNLPFGELYCLIHPENQVSIHLAEKLGFEYLDLIQMEGKEYRRYFLVLNKREIHTIKV